MLFNSLIFPFFLLIVLLVYYLLRYRAQNSWLLVVSYVFYGWWDWRFCSLLLFSTILDWFVSHSIEEVDDEKRRKQLLLLSVIGNLGVLSFFKYFNFFIDSFRVLFEGLGLYPDFFTLNIILPVGISFYTFQTMSYTIDVYRRKQKPAADFISFALYVSFFPQLVAGPIERADRLIPQFSKTRKFTSTILKSALPLILFGFFKKVVVADSIAPIVDNCFLDPSKVSGLDLLFGIYAFAIQIYFDFSGYTDIARGVSKLLGIELQINFTAPYFSRNITEFWRRWHISLSSWLRDYLYISLGGNRKGRLRTDINLMLTMLLGGLWHGAAWTFVIWGGLHGTYLILHKIALKGKKPDIHSWGNSSLGYLGDVLFIILTFNLVCLSWVFFRAPSLGLSIQYIQGIFLNPGELSIFKPVVLSLLMLIVIDIGQRLDDNYLWFNSIPTYWKYTLGSVLVIASILSFGWHYGTANPFIYFQF